MVEEVTVERVNRDPEPCGVFQKLLGVFRKLVWPYQIIMAVGGRGSQMFRLDLEFLATYQVLLEDLEKVPDVDV